MRTRKALIFTLFLITCMSVFFLTASAESKKATFYTGDTVYAETATDEQGLLTMPGAPQTGDAVFVGWVLEKENGEKHLFAPGAAFRAESGNTALTFRAFSVDLHTLTGAAAGLTLPYSLRFDAALSGSDYRTLVSLVGAENITLGLLTAPYEKIIGKGENFTPAGGADFITVSPATLTGTSGKTLLFSARVEGISEKQLLDKFAARGYLTVRFEDGTTTTVLAPFRNTDHARSVHAVLAAAFEDVKDNADATHTAEFEYGDAMHFSPYTAAERDFMEAGLDHVISVDTLFENNREQVSIAQEYSMDGIRFQPFRYYSSPYIVVSVTYEERIATVSVRATGGANIRDVTTYYLGGSYSSAHPGNILIVGDTLTFSYRTDTTIQ